MLTLAVILSAAKDPEELNAPKPSVLFEPYCSAPLPLSVLFSPPRHFDRSRSRLCERRSGEICFCPCFLHLSLLFYPTPNSAKTHLSLLTLAVILSAAKDPEELNAPKTIRTFRPILFCAFARYLSLLPRNRHFDRIRSRLSEWRSGEICFCPCYRICLCFSTQHPT
jgi:hypothetical protein